MSRDNHVTEATTQFHLLYIYADNVFIGFRGNPDINNTLTGHPVRCIAE